MEHQPFQASANLYLFAGKNAAKEQIQHGRIALLSRTMTEAQKNIIIGHLPEGYDISKLGVLRLSEYDQQITYDGELLGYITHDGEFVPKKSWAK